MPTEPSAVEQAVSRTLRENLESIQRTSNELHQAIGDFVAACSSSRSLNALPPMIRAQMSAASLSATLEVLARLVTAVLQPADRAATMTLEAQRIPSIPVAQPALASEVSEASEEKVRVTIAPQPAEELVPPMDVPVSSAPPRQADSVSLDVPPQELAPVPVVPSLPIPPAMHTPVDAVVAQMAELVSKAMQDSRGLRNAGLPPNNQAPVAPPEPPLESVIQPVAVSGGTEHDSLWAPDSGAVPESVASTAMNEFSEPPAAPDAAAGEFDVASLPVEQQELHRRANRVAKVSMQDIKMLRPEDVRLGRENRDLCTRLRDDIEKAHKEYDRRFQSILSHPVDYFYNWMVEILAGGESEALGEYPYHSAMPRR